MPGSSLVPSAHAVTEQARQKELFAKYKINGKTKRLLAKIQGAHGNFSQIRNEIELVSEEQPAAPFG